MSKDTSHPGPRMVRRFLSPTQAATRDRLIEAAIAAATDSGYEGAGVREVASRAGVSPATAYQHVNSKDQLLIEALLLLGDRVTENVLAHPPAETGPARRISDVFARIMRQAAQKPLLYQALFRAYIATYPAMAGSEEVVGFGPERTAWIGHALRAGDTTGHDDAEIESASRVLSTMFLGAIVGVAAGRDVHEVVEVLDEAAHRLLPEPA